MSEPINDGGQAFPYREEDGYHSFHNHFGMTLRDWFAGQALAGMRSNPNPEYVAAGGDKISAWAYEDADAMIEERTNETK